MKGRGAQIFQKSMSQLKILGARRVTSSKFHTEDPQILGAAAQNVVATATRRPGFMDPLLNRIQMYHVKRRNSKLISVNATKANGGGGLARLILNIGTRRRLSDQLHNPGCFIPMMPTEQRLGRPHSRYRRRGYKKNMFAPAGNQNAIPRLPTPKPSHYTDCSHTSEQQRM
jgi:hypothetical protein